MIQIAVIGFGFMGMTHALHIRRNPRLKLAAIVTRAVESIDAKLNGQVGNFPVGDLDADSVHDVPRFTTLEACLREVRLDAVHICVHTDQHIVLATEAIRCGLHVFLEKPFTLNIREGEALIALAQAQNVKLMVGHVVRFMPAYKKLKEWIDTNPLGPLSFLSLTRFTGLPAWGQWSEKQAVRGSSGGALFDLLIHDIDFVYYVLGEPGYIEATCYPGALSDHDYVSAHWHYNKFQVKVEGGNAFHATFPFQAGFMARFQKASVVYASQQPEFIHVCTPDKTFPVPVGDASEGFYDEINYFASCILNDTPPIECTPESSLKTIDLCYRHISAAINGVQTQPQTPRLTP
jgi:predicted dehydrogenase